MNTKFDARIFVAGHNGMVGRALVRCLRERGYTNLVTQERSELNLLDKAAVHSFFQQEKIDKIYLAAAKVGGIYANNTYPADFIYENLTIQNNIIHTAHQADINKLLFLGSSCIYPKYAEQPIKEEALLTGELESTNEAYAIAKIAGIKMCESYNRQYGRDYRSAMPTNLYGPYDNFHLENSHVVPGLLRRFHEAVLHKAKEVVIWGSGNPLRELLHVDDMAAACVHLMELDQLSLLHKPQHINVGTGVDCSITELAELIAQITGFKGKLTFDATKPDGTPRKLLDVSRLTSLGWQANITLDTGLKDTYKWLCAHYEGIINNSRLINNPVQTVS